MTIIWSGYNRTEFEKKYDALTNQRFNITFDCVQQNLVDDKAHQYKMNNGYIIVFHFNGLIEIGQ